MKHYRSSGRFSFNGLIGLLLATLIGSLLIGGLAYFVSRWIYLVVLFPMLMAGFGGGLLMLVVKGTKVRSPILAGLFGLLLGVGMIGVMHSLQYYVDFRGEFHDAAIKRNPSITPEQEQALLDKFFQDETHDTGIVGYLKFSARQGLTITRGVSNDMNLDERGVWVYWGIELVTVMVIAAGLAFNAARQPFNEDAGQWYPDGSIVANVNWKQRKEFKKLLKAGDYAGASKLVTPGTSTNLPYLGLNVQRTPNVPESYVILNIQEVRWYRRRQIEKTIIRGVLTPSELRLLLNTTQEEELDPIKRALSQSSPVIG